MKKLTLFTAIAIILSLFLVTTQALASSAGVVEAKGPPGGTPGPHNTPGAQATVHAGQHGKPDIIRGTISKLNLPISLTVTPSDGSPDVVIGISTDTRINIPGSHNSGATLQTGMQVMVMAFTNPNNNGLVAKFVLVIPGQPSRVHRVGWVTDYTAHSSITIQVSDGQLYKFALTDNTKFLPASTTPPDSLVGLRVTIIAPRDPSSTVWTAVAIVIHPEGSGSGSQPVTVTPTP